MNIIEKQFVTQEQAPKCCTYCGEEKKFLLAKPVAFSVNGEMTINVNYTSKQLWMCLDCLSMELDALGLSVDIYEYE
jgi:hypothetical protein